MQNTLMTIVIGHVQSTGDSGGLAVEQRNRDCESDTPQCLELAMMKVYKVDKAACLKHIAAKEGIILSYRSRSEEAI